MFIKIIRQIFQKLLHLPLINNQIINIKSNFIKEDVYDDNIEKYIPDGNYYNKYYNDKIKTDFSIFNLSFAVESFLKDCKEINSNEIKEIKECFNFEILFTYLKKNNKKLVIPLIKEINISKDEISILLKVNLSLIKNILINNENFINYYSKNNDFTERKKIANFNLFIQKENNNYEENQIEIFSDYKFKSLDIQEISLDDNKILYGYLKIIPEINLLDNIMRKKLDIKIKKDFKLSYNILSYDLLKFIKELNEEQLNEEKEDNKIEGVVKASNYVINNPNFYLKTYQPDFYNEKLESINKKQTINEKYKELLEKFEVGILFFSNLNLICIFEEIKIKINLFEGFNELNLDKFYEKLIEIEKPKEIKIFLEKILWHNKDENIICIPNNVYQETIFKIPKNEINNDENDNTNDDDESSQSNTNTNTPPKKPRSKFVNIIIYGSIVVVVIGGVGGIIYSFVL